MGGDGGSVPYFQPFFTLLRASIRRYYIPNTSAANEVNGITLVRLSAIS